MNRWFKKKGLGCRVYGVGFRVSVSMVILMEIAEEGMFSKWFMSQFTKTLYRLFNYLA
jgi:hypothetical protein